MWLHQKHEQILEQRKELDGSHIQVMCFETQPNGPTRSVTYLALLYTNKQMFNNIVYKGQVFKLD